MVEFALVFLMLAAILFGAMGFADALYTYHFVGHASKEATRWAAVNGSTCTSDSTCSAPATQTTINAYVQGFIPPGVAPGHVVTTASWPVQADGPSICSAAVGALPVTPNAPGCTVEVTVSYPYQFNFVLLNNIVPAARATAAPCTTPGICMSSSSEMVIVH